MADLVDYFGWSFTVAPISTSDDYGSGILSAFLKQMTVLNATVLASQQFYPYDTQLWDLTKVIKESGARAIVSFMDIYNFNTLSRFAERMNMTSEKYVWFCSDACATSAILYDVTPDSTSSSLNKAIFNRMKGMIGLRLPGGIGPNYQRFLDLWKTLDPLEYPGAGSRETSMYVPYAYDAVVAAASSLSFALLTSGVVTPQLLTLSLANFSFVGLTGNVSFDTTGTRRLPEYAITNLRQTSEPDHPFDFVVVGNWSGLDPSLSKGKITFDFNPHFYDGTSNRPDLDIRNPITYWSCQHSEEITDPTGKIVRLQPPGPPARSIAYHYRCDKFLDCYNMSDEWGCTVSFPIVFIVYGIIVLVLMAFSVFCMIFTIVFGFIIKRKRVRAASPTFLLLMAAASIVGY